MNFDQKKFLSQIPKSFTEVYEVLSFHGYACTLVGGVVRDFLLTSKVGRDWDLELRHPTLAFNKLAWKDLGSALSKIGKITYLPYEIIRLDLRDIQYEFSPPRVELFKDNWQEAGHSNFEAEFDLKLPFEDPVLRRDFTVNAIGLKFLSSKTFELVDPLNGVLHLRDRLLHPGGENFGKDPVRFIRALRFQQKLGFTATKELQDILLSMPITGLTPAYLWSEMLKSGDPFSFYKKLVDWKLERPELTLPASSGELNGRWEELSRVLVDPRKHESWIIAMEWIGLSAQDWQKFFSISSETSSRLGRWAQSSKKFIQIRPELFHGEFEEVREKEEFALLFDWYFTTKQLLQKNPELPLLKMVEEYLPEWIHLYRFEAVKDVKHIDPPLRAKYQVWNLCQRL